MGSCVDKTKEKKKDSFLYTFDFDIIATDCIIRAIASTLSGDEMVRAYADDIAVVARCFQNACLRLVPIFRCVQKCSCLALNPKKCVLVPLWPESNRDTLRGWINLYHPEWADMRVESFAEYLGFCIGPGSAHKEWQKVMRKVLEASSFIKALGMPKIYSLRLMHMFGYSQLQFVAQLRSPCRALRRIELQTIRDIIGGPGLWASCDLFFHLRANDVFAVDLKAFDTLCLATLLKTAMLILSCMYMNVNMIS